AFASLEGRKLSIMVWHYHDDDVAGADAAVELNATGLGGGSGTATLTQYRIDQEHSNSYAAWKKIGSPIAPNEREYAALEAAEKLPRLGSPEQVKVEQGPATIKLPLPRQAVSLLVLEW